RDRDRPRRRQDLTFERELAEERPARHGADGDLGGGRENRHGDRQIEPRSLLPEIARRKIDDDPPKGPLESRVLHRRPDTLASVLHGGAGKPGHRERRKTPPDERLNRHGIAADSEQRDADDPTVHEGRTVATRSDTHHFSR